MDDSHWAPSPQLLLCKREKGGPRQRKLLLKRICVIHGIQIQTWFANTSKYIHARYIAIFISLLYFVAVVIENIAKTEKEEGDIFVKRDTFDLSSIV